MHLILHMKCQSEYWELFVSCFMCPGVYVTVVYFYGTCCNIALVKCVLFSVLRVS